MSWPLEVEHRLTVLEVHMRTQGDINTRTDKRITNLRYLIMGIIGVLNTIAHDKLPEWAKAAVAILKATAG